MAITNIKNPVTDPYETGPSPFQLTKTEEASSVSQAEMQEDPRFAAVEADKKAALSSLEGTYDGMIGGSDQYFQAQQDAVKQWGEKQLEAQKASTDFTIEQLEAQKAKAEEDYKKEQSAAYVDWQKQSNAYGAEAERLASMGMKGTGFSESAQVAMYNAYQNRVAVARAAVKDAVASFDVAIKDAQLKGDVAAAEIAYSTLQQSLELSLTGFQYKNDLILEKTGQKLALEQEHYNRYLDVLDQINTENALEEEIRQFDTMYGTDLFVEGGEETEDVVDPVFPVLDTVAAVERLFSELSSAKAKKETDKVKNSVASIASGREAAMQGILAPEFKKKSGG